MRRRLKRWVIAFAVGVLALAVWGVGIEPRLIDWSHQRADIPGLPSAWDGRVVALMADLQVGMWLGNTDATRRAVAGLVERRPAAVLIAGDFVYQPTDDEREDVREDYERDDVRAEIAHVIDLLRPLVDAGIPTYAVLGNHDYAMGGHEAVKLGWVAVRVRAALTALGIRVLHNEAVPLATPGDHDADGARRAGMAGTALHLVGLGPFIPREADIAAALAEVPDDAPRIVFMHNPDVFAQLPAGAAPLALAGHTHGGQVRLPFMPSWSWFALATDDAVHTDGWIHRHGAPDNRLYVNRGIGMSALPVRINCRPEVTLITLQRRPAS